MIGRIGLTAILALTPPAAGAATLCNQIVAFARKQPDKAWAAGDTALAPALVFDESHSAGAEHPKLTAFEMALTRRKDVRAAIDDPAGDWGVFVDHLAGTDLYLLSAYQGSMSCQLSVLLRGGRIINRPPAGDGDGEACYTTSEGLGRAFGQPIHVIHDKIAPTTKAAAFSITPWTGERWGKTCKLTLTFRANYQPIERRCGDPSVCAAGGKVGADVARRYRQVRETGPADAKFSFGPPAPPAVSEDFATLGAGVDFPDFGDAKAEPRGFGGDGRRIFPLQLNGRWYLAAVGQEGVGWRENENTLFAVYAPDKDALTPLAGYVFARSLAGLADARAP